MNEIDISNKIHTIRGLQVMLDRDLAELYHVETKQLNRAVKRNIERYPNEFMFQLTESEFNSLRSQIATTFNELEFQNGISMRDSLRFQNGTLKKGRGKHRKYTPYAFTEQGVANLSSVLTNNKAIQVNIQIIRAFVAMRRFISSNAQLFQRLDTVERKQIEYDGKLEKIFEALEVQKPKQGIFFEGQIFEAYKFASNLIRTAKKSIVLIDNFVDDSVLTLFSKSNVDVTIFTKNYSKVLKLDLDKYNSQHKPITIKEFKNSHDN